MRYLTPENVMKWRLKEGIPAWKAAVICFRDLSGSKQLVEAFGARPLGRKVLYGMDECEAAPFVYEMIVAGEHIGVVTRCLWGGPQASIVVEELSHIGVEYIIGCGAAGSLESRLTRGAQIVAASAPPTDGTSQSYVTSPKPLEPDPRLLEILMKCCGTSVSKVEVATVDVLYRETHELIDDWRSKGVQAINMETAAFYAACSTCGVSGLWLGHVSDCLVDGVWEDWSVDREEMSRVTARICVRVLEAIVHGTPGTAAGY